MRPTWRVPPRVVGHRGCPREAPENTLASFRQAVVRGAVAIELDVRLTADDEVVVVHDAALGRTVAGEGLVEETSAEDLLARDAGSWFHPRFAHERVPTLAAVLSDIPRDVLLDVEIKADALNATRLPSRVHDVVAQHGALDRVLVTSFDAQLASEYAAMARRPAGLLLLAEPDEADVADWPLLGFFAVHEGALSPAALDLLLGAGKSVLAWTVNDVPEARRLLEAGVASIITDAPGDMVAL